MGKGIKDDELSTQSIGIVSHVGVEDRGFIEPLLIGVLLFRVTLFGV